MGLDILVNYTMTLMTHLADTILAFALFRIKMNHRIIATISFIWGTFSYYIRFILETPFFPVLNLVCFLILLMIVRKYPFFYAFLVSTLTFVIYNLIETVLAVAMFESGLTSLTQIKESLLHFAVANTVLCSIYILLAIFLKRAGIGFSLIIGKYRSNEVMKKYNVIWAGLLVAIVMIVQISVYMKWLSYHTIILLFLTFGAFIVLRFSFRQNQRELEERSLKIKRADDRGIRKGD